MVTADQFILGTDVGLSPIKNMVLSLDDDKKPLTG